jgi:phage terminase large subunit-like protein
VSRSPGLDLREANLAPGFFDQIIGKYEGTRLGRQELNAELLEDTPGALWSHGIIDATRQATAPNLARIVVAIDPAATSGEEAARPASSSLGRISKVTAMCLPMHEKTPASRVGQNRHLGRCKTCSALRANARFGGRVLCTKLGR